MESARMDKATPWNELDWQTRQERVVKVMREMSSLQDPQAMVRMYGQWMREHRPVEAFLAISRRGMEAPKFRVTRSSRWDGEINPWKERDKLPVLEGGILGELIYGNEPLILNDFHPDPSDPAYEFLEGFRSLRAIPAYDEGQSLNMTISLDSRVNGFDLEGFPEQVWMANLFGRATSNLVLRTERDEAFQELREAHRIQEEQSRVIGEIQRSLLPPEIPEIPRLDLAVHYQPSELAGGDAWDVFELPNGRWGIFIADVSGHGTPAAVIMAILNTLSHTCPVPAWTEHGCPGALLEYLNEHLGGRYATSHGAFVTAFLGVFDPETRKFAYANAGHAPARIKRCADGSVFSLDAVGGIPLAIMPGIAYEAETVQLERGDQVVLTTDGITEAFGGELGNELFGHDRLDEAISECMLDAGGLVKSVVDAVDRHAAGRPAGDDQTLVVAKVG